MTPGTPGRLSRKELIARAAIGMPAGHPELVTRKPTRAEWKQLTAWLTELWPNDEYTTIVTEALRHDRPPGTQGLRWAPWRTRRLPSGATMSPDPPEC